MNITTIDQAPGWDIPVEVRIKENGDDPLVSFYDLEPTDSGKMVKIPAEPLVSVRHLASFEGGCGPPVEVPPSEPGLINTFPLSELKKWKGGMCLGTGRYKRAIGIYLEPYPISSDELAKVVTAAKALTSTKKST